MYKLIIADDDSRFLERFCRLVDWKAHGFEVAAMLFDGEDVIKYIEENSVDAVITDIRMPVKTGIDVASFIYEKHPNIKVMFFSAYKSFDYAVEAVAYDVVGYITKPMNFAQLNEALEKLKSSLSKKDYTNRFIDDKVIKARKKAVGEYLSEAAAELNAREAELRPSGNLFTCALIGFKVPNFREYAESIWKHGEKQLYDAFMRIVCYETEEYYSIPAAFCGGDTVILIAAKSQGVDVEKAENDIKLRIKECFSLECEMNGFYKKDNLKELKKDLNREERGFLNSAKQLILKSAESEHTEEDIRKINEYMDKNFNKDISKKDIAAILYMSESSVNRFFTEHIGCKFVDYLNKVRIEKAKQMIKNDTIPISEIHNYLGYKSKAHFFKIFKQYVKDTPLKYRQKHMKTGKDS